MTIKEKLTILYQERGMGLREIAEKIGRSHEWVRTNLGDEISKRKKINNCKEIYELYKEKGIKAVIKKYKITQTYAYRISKKGRLLSKES